MDRLQQIENLPAFLAAEGLEVVRGEWLKNSPYPVLYVRPVARPDAPCTCGHNWALHDHEGCLEFGCRCHGYNGAAHA